MTLLSGAALAALVFLVPLVALHLRRRKPPRRAVGSLLAWRDLPAAGGGGARRIGRPPLPLLLLLQVLALVVLVVALARPASNESATTSSHVYVVDQSMWMGAEQGGRRGSTPPRRCCANGSPNCPATKRCGSSAPGRPRPFVFEGDAADAGPALARLRAGPGAANLTAALRLAAGLRAGDEDRIALLRAPEDAAPRVRGGGSSTKTSKSANRWRTLRSPARAPTATASAKKPAKSSSASPTPAAPGGRCRCASRSAANRSTPCRSKSPPAGRRRSSSPLLPGPPSR